MIIKCRTQSLWGSRSTTLLTDISIPKRLPRRITFDINMSNCRLIDMDGKTVISDKLISGSTISTKNNYYNVYIYIDDNIDITNLKKCYLY